MTARVTDLFVYPLKSAQGLRLTSATVTATGLAHDRSFMLVHAQGERAGQFITQRDKGCEKLAVVQPFFRSGEIGFLFPSGEEISPCDIHLSDNSSDVNIWNDACKAYDAGERAAQAFSDYLGIACRLVRKSDTDARYVDPNFAQESDIVGFADGFPLLVTSKSSLEALQAHFDKAQGVIGMERFRPNIVVEHLAPFQEDIIGKVRIGNDVVIEHLKPCARCKITLVDQFEGVLSGKEPLKTLSHLRRGEGGGLSGAFFGQNAVPRILGQIAVGDHFEILSEKELHPALETVKLRP